MNVSQYKKRLKTFSVEKNVEKVVKRSSKEIIELNKVNLSKGLNSYGTVVGRYSFFTLRYAKLLKPKKPKQVGGLYNFYWTGRFIKGIFITYIDNKIVFKSKGMGYIRKSRFINDNKLLGVTEKQSSDINYKILSPKLQQLFQKHIGR
mgnify:FL=1|tara:strand:- start:11101 stop:11544 length:444 start_codon:yes stop_codon:yes gene_type:complete